VELRQPAIDMSQHEDTDRQLSRPSPERRRTYAGPVAVGIVVRLTLALAINGSILFPDEAGYDRVGRVLSSAWHAHITVDPSAYNIAGTTDVGYFLYVGAIYYIIPSVLALSLCNAVISGCGAYFAGRIGEKFGVGRVSAWLVALYPTAIFWGATGLKDGVLGTVFLVAIMMAFEAPTLFKLLVQGAAVTALFLTRPLLGGISLSVEVIALWSASKGGRRGCAFGVLGLAGTAGLILIVGVPAYRSDLAAASSVAGGAALSNLSIFGVVRGLLGPFPWSYGSGVSAVGIGQYPGQSVLILLLPSIAVGGWEMIRRGTPMMRALVFSTVVYTLAYQSVAEFSGGFFRQRFDAELLFLVFAAYAWHVSRRKSALATASWLCVLPVAALLQSGAPPLAGIALLSAVAVAAWFAIRVRRGGLFVSSGRSVA
jgi:hypothetical protein